VRWHLLTGEYPPGSGGVGDYTARLARALVEAGDSVDVWIGGAAADSGAGPLRVHALPDRFGARSRAALGEAWDRSPGTVLLQYVPNALGARGANLAFTRWLAARRRRGDDVRVMFHEPYIYFSVARPWLNALAIAQRAMAATLIRASARIYVSTDQWGRYLRPYGADRLTTLPIPATIAAGPPAPAIDSFRKRFTRHAGPVLGHFGTFGGDVSGELEPALREIMRRRPGLNIALVGANGGRFRQHLIAGARGADAAAIIATERLEGEDAAAALSACDILLQPYPDGATTRRTSLMAGLREGVATVTTRGFLTETIWSESGAVVLADAGEPARIADAVERLLDDANARREQGARGRETYARSFSMAITVERLRSE
jgi:glycosyltransferase involved in cell wall biosynthesis